MHGCTSTLVHRTSSPFRRFPVSPFQIFLPDTLTLLFLTKPRTLRPSHFGLFLPPLRVPINALPVFDSKDDNLVPLYSENDPVVSHTQLPVAFQCFPKGLTVFLGRGHQALFYGSSDLPTDGLRESRDVLSADIGMVGDAEEIFRTRHRRGQACRQLSGWRPFPPPGLPGRRPPSVPRPHG